MENGVRNKAGLERSGFLREGWHELRRKFQRSKFRKQLQEQDRERNAALALLGQRAWQEKIDLSAFADLRDQISRLEARASELSATTKKLRDEKAELEARRQTEIVKFNSQRQAVEEKKRPVDAALRAAQERLGEQDRTAKRIDARQTEVTAELAKLSQQMAALEAAITPEQAGQLSAAQGKRRQLELEQKHLSEELSLAGQALPGLAAEVNRLHGESQRLGAQISKIEAERNAVVSPITAGLERVEREIQGASGQASAVEREQSDRFIQLGLALYDRKVTEPALAGTVEQISAIDRTRAALQAALEASLALRRAMPRGTMLKFWATLVLMPVLLVGVGFGTYAGWEWWKQRHQPKELEAGAQINPYLTHALSSHPAYVLAGRLATATSEQGVGDRMREAFQAIHLGVYSHDGKQIVAGAERNEKDFFLYDFQWKTLARAFFRHNVMNFANQSEMLGRTLLRLNQPSHLDPVLKRAILLRYQQAASAPNDPSSFLILLLDGLARQQLKPYSLAEIEERPAKDLYVDPLQSFLIILDFFISPRQETPGVTLKEVLPWDWNALRVVYAGSPCDAIKGDKDQKHWGYGVKAAQTAGEQIAGQAAEKAGSAAAREVAGKIAEGAEKAGEALEIAEAAGDLLILYGITINIRPTDYVTHLRHDEDHITGFLAKVTFEPDGVPDEAIKCGWLVGKKMPQPHQPMKDVELTWDIEPEWPPYLVVPHEVVVKLTGHLGFQTKTDADGQSDFGVSPTDCPDKTGRIVGRDLMMTATARVLTREIPTPGLLGVISLVTKLGPGAIEYLMRGRTGYCRFRVEWHKKAPKLPQYGGG